MRSLFRSSALLVLLSAPAVFSACHDQEEKDDLAAKPTGSGVIVGRIKPFGDITVVTAMSASGAATNATLVSVNSGGYTDYTISNLNTGTYTVTYTPLTGTLTPSAQTAAVVDGDTTELMIITTERTPTTDVSFTINGTSVPATHSGGGYYTSNNTFALGAGTAVANPFSARLNIEATGVTGPGSYPIRHGTGHAGNNSFIIDSGTLQVTSLDLVRRRIAGTFTAAATANAALGTSAANVTNGTFNLALH